MIFLWKHLNQISTSSAWVSRFSIAPTSLKRYHAKLKRNHCFVTPASWKCRHESAKKRLLTTRSTTKNDCALWVRNIANASNEGFILMRGLACIYPPYRSVFIQRLMKSDVVKKVVKKNQLICLSKVSAKIVD